MSTAIPDDSRPRLKLVAAGGTGIVLGLALFKLVLHVWTTGRFGYSYFVDELYFLACGEHLAWGYVDLPPLFPAITAGVRALFGDSLMAVRLVPALAGAALVWLTGRLARDLGGGVFAQALAALAIVTAPIYLALDSLHTMNALEPLFWMGCAWLVLRIVQGADPKLWLLFGALAGLGLLNKHSMAFFGSGIALGLLLTPERRTFRQPWIWLGGLIALLLFLPNLLWMIRHGFPHFEMLANIRRDGRDVELSVVQFLAQQILIVHPVAAPIWIAGLAWLLFGREGRRYRVLGIAYLVVLGELLLLSRRVYYLAPAYPMLLAAGGVVLEQRAGARRWLKASYAGILAIAGAILAPLTLPCLPPETYVRYTQTLHLEPPRIETHRLGVLPQLFADRFGWREMVDEVSRIYHELPPAEQAKAAIFGQDYGQAGAIDLFGPRLGLPKAISGHLTYFYWGPRDATGEVVIVLDDDQETLERVFEDVHKAGHVEHPYSRPGRHFDVFVCRRLKGSMAELWPRIKKFR